MTDANGYVPEGAQEPPATPRPRRGGFSDPAVRAKAQATAAANRSGKPAASMRDIATEKADRVAEASSNRAERASRARREAVAKETEEAREKGIRRADGTYRRKRPTMDGLRDSRLDQALQVEQDHETYGYRWVNNELGRIDRLQANDWDVVEGQPQVPSGASRTRPGEPRMKVLMRKRKDDLEADMRERNARVNAELERVRADPLGAGGLANAAYEASRGAGLEGTAGSFYVSPGWQNGYEQGV